MCLSVNCELYHYFYIDRLIERSRWEYLEASNLVNFVHLDMRTLL
jgi:hypothetical protein